VRDEFEWRDRHFSKGSWVILDLYGTNHDTRLWEDPSKFQPERFRQWDGSAFDFIPQGGGEYYTGHRCPGE
jgi:fatty-acid peroxygenase